MEQIKVAVSVDENYVYPLRVMLYSLFSTQDMPVKVFLIHTKLKNETVEELKKFCLVYKAELEEVRLEDDIFSDAPVRMYFTTEMYYRLLLPWLLPKEDRILYLDVDLIVLHTLSELWKMEFESYLLAAVKDLNLCRKGGMTLIHTVLKKDTVYVNSGVLLMNLKGIREEKSIDEILIYQEKYKEKLQFYDQDLINLLYEGRIRLLNDHYNFSPNYLYVFEEQLGIFFISGKKIIHYMGPDKPWEKSYWRNLYWPWAKLEWQVYPGKRFCIVGRTLLEPLRYLKGIFFFVKSIRLSNIKHTVKIRIDKIRRR